MYSARRTRNFPLSENYPYVCTTNINIGGAAAPPAPPGSAPLSAKHAVFLRSLTSKEGRQLFGRRKVHPERENPGYAYEKRVLALWWYGATRMDNPALPNTFPQFPKKVGLLLPGGARSAWVHLQLFLRKFGPEIFSPSWEVHVHAVHPLATPMEWVNKTTDRRQTDVRYVSNVNVSSRSLQKEGREKKEKEGTGENTPPKQKY